MLLKHFLFLALDIFTGFAFLGTCWILKISYRSKFGKSLGPIIPFFLIWGGVICNILLASKVLDSLEVKDSDSRQYLIWLWQVPMLLGLILGMYFFNPRKGLKSLPPKDLVNSTLRTCPKCGSKIDEGSKFCGACGSQIVD